MSEATATWQVLLIGGGSGVGKSVAAQDLAKTLQISPMLVDDIRIAIQAVTSPSQLPALHYFLSTENAVTLPTEAFITGLIGVGRTLIPALRDVISHHVAVPTAGRLILEGDGILPELMDGLHLSDVNGAALVGGATNVRSVFLYEADEAQLLRNFVARDRGFNQGATAEQRQYVHTIWHFGRWVKAEAARYSLPVVPARPYATLVQRILAAVASTDEDLRTTNDASA